MLDAKLVKETCTQHCDHRIITVWPSWTKIKTGIWTQCRSWESSFKRDLSSTVVLFISKTILNDCCSTNEIDTDYTDSIRWPQCMQYHKNKGSRPYDWKVSVRHV